MHIGIAAGHSSISDTPQDTEHAQCLRALKVLERLLLTAGHDVSIPLESAVGHLSNDAALRRKVEVFNARRVDLAIELHLNAGGGDYGLMMYHATGPAGAVRYSPAGSALASHLAEAFAWCGPVSDTRSRSEIAVGRGGLHMLDRTIAPAVIVEPAFMDGPDAHREWIASESFAADYATLVYLGIQRYARAQRGQT